MSDRRKGVPRTDEDRSRRHGKIFNNDKLPPRGTGLKKGTAAGSKSTNLFLELLTPILMLGVISLIHSLFSTKKHKN